MQPLDFWDLVPEEWREEFVRFVETGEASEHFYAYLDTNANTQLAVDRAFEAQSSDFTELFKKMKEHAQVPQKLASAIKTARTMPLDERREVAERVASILVPNQDERRESVAKDINLLIGG